MAKLTALPEQSIINMLAGIIDYYIWGACRGTPIPCARRWPRYDPSAYPPASIATRYPFAYINQMLQAIPGNLRLAYLDMAGGTGLTWADMARRCYINGDMV